MLGDYRSLRIDGSKLKNPPNKYANPVQTKVQNLIQTEKQLELNFSLGSFAEHDAYGRVQLDITELAVPK